MMKRNAFSLIELSVVLVILGLLTGGILAGQSLVAAAKLRSVTTELAAFQTATHSFEDKYFGLPGDLMDATAYWGAAHATLATCFTTVGTAPETCNGNGDGIIVHDAGAADTRSEGYMFWQHLSNAGMIEGAFNGMSGDGGGEDNVELVNVPKSKYRGGGWNIDDGNPTAGDSERYALNYGKHVLEFGGKQNNGDNDLALLTPEEAWEIDSKIDDGRPGLGKVIARFWDDECAIANAAPFDETNLDADYKVQDETEQCSLIFLEPF